MAYKSDIEIAQQAKLKPIMQVAEKLGIGEEYTEAYGKYKAKIDYNVLKEYSQSSDGKLILVTAITPTPAGEGKTTTTVGLGDALNRLGKKAMIALREPSLGPVFGIKGGAAGGGYAQVLPMEDKPSLHRGHTQSERQTIFWLLWLTTIYTRAMSLISTQEGLCGEGQWI